MKQTFIDYFKAWDALDNDAVLAFFTDDIVYEDTTVKHTATGTKQMRRFIQASFDNVPDARFEYVGHVTPTPIRGGVGDAPDERPRCAIGKLRDGKICEQRDYWNGAAFKVPNT